MGLNLGSFKSFFIGRLFLEKKTDRMNKSLNVCLINALYFLTPKEIRILTQTNKKLKQQISENKKLWIHFIESKYGSLKECIHQMYYIPYSFLSYNEKSISVLKFTPHLDFENMSKSIKNEISKFGKFKSDKTEFDKIFENSKQMLNQNHPGIFKRTNPPMKDVKYFSMTMEEEKIDHFEFGFFIYNEEYFSKKKKNQISFDQFQEQFLIQDVMQNVFEFLNDSEILNVSTVCKYWHSISNESNFLLNQIQKKYGSWMNSMLDRCIFEYLITGSRSSNVVFIVDEFKKSSLESKNLIDNRLKESMTLIDRNSGKQRIDRMLTIYLEKTLLDDDIYEFGYFTFPNFREGYSVPFASK
jgi:hypothetical protein